MLVLGFVAALSVPAFAQQRSNNIQPVVQNNSATGRRVAPDTPNTTDVIVTFTANPTNSCNGTSSSVESVAGFIIQPHAISTLLVR
jgi:hypothetical protein